jgi:hypothetical protein
LNAPILASMSALGRAPASLSLVALTMTKNRMKSPIV